MDARRILERYVYEHHCSAGHPRYHRRWPDWFYFIGAKHQSLALLSSSDNRPLALLQLEYMVEGRYEAASVIGAVVVVVTVGIALLAYIFGFRLGPTHR